MSANILLVDIETAPVKGYFWGLWKQNIPIKMIQEEWFMLSWCSKWLGDEVVHSSALPYYDLYKTEPHNDYYVVKEVWDYLDKADIVIAHNAARFDIPKIQAKFLEHKLPPTSPFKIIDTLLVAKKEFKLTSNKLDYLAKVLGLDGKLSHDGWELWDGCINGDPESWANMVDYNVQDVHLLEKVYLELRPWIKNHPNIALYDEKIIPRCPKCGSSHIHKRGTYKTNVGVYQRYHCNTCNGWSRERTQDPDFAKTKRKSILTNVA